MDQWVYESVGRWVAGWLGGGIDGCWKVAGG